MSHSRFLQDSLRQPESFAAERLRARKDENSRLLRADIAAGRDVFRGLPEVVGLYTSDVCNLACRMCPRSLAQGEQILPREALESVCRELFPTARKVILTGAAGEPLLHDFDLVLSLALRFAVRMDLITNGTLLTRELYRKAAPAFREGFPLAVLEAFGAGCLVVGFAGRGGLEFMRDGENSLVVADGDVSGVLARVEALRGRTPEELTGVLARARETATSYGRRTFEDRLEAVFAERTRPMARGRTPADG